MPLFLDIHRDIEGLTAEAIDEAHRRDLALQAKYGISLLKHWFDTTTNTAFCLMNAPNKEACVELHREAHGLLANEVFQVTEGIEPDN